MDRIITENVVAGLPPSMYYIREFLSDDEAAELWRHVYEAPRPKWVVLKNRRLQNWGGALSERGLRMCCVCRNSMRV